MKFKTIVELLLEIDEPNRSYCQKIYSDNFELFTIVTGSSNNHQVWPGGYHDHVKEAMNLGKGLFEFLQTLKRPLPFTLSDVLLIIFLHDIEKTLEVFCGFRRSVKY